MPGITFTASDLASTNKLDPSWYKLIVRSVTSGPGKKDPSSITWEVSLEVAEGAAAGTPIKTWFSDKFMKPAVFFMGCFVANIEPGKEYPIEGTVGKHVLGYCKFNMEQKNNEVLDFKKAA